MVGVLITKKSGIQRKLVPVLAASLVLKLRFIYWLELARRKLLPNNKEEIAVLGKIAHEFEVRGLTT